MFNIPKIVAPEISLKGNYSLDINGQFYSTTTIYGYIKKNGCAISDETLMAILNSQLCWWYLVNTGTVLANGYYRYKPAYLKPFPIPYIPKSIDLHIQEKVKARVELKNNFEKAEKEINRIIYDLYGLSTDEIEIIEKA